MKIRTGFVSNSSSSSFVCCVCGETVTSWDCSLSDAEMYACVNGHTFCRTEAVEDVGDDEGDEGGDCIPEKYCPVCNFLEASHYDIGRYFEKTATLKKAAVFAQVKAINKRRKKLYDNEYVEAVCHEQGRTLSQVVASIKEQFKTYGEFLKFLRESA